MAGSYNHVVNDAGGLLKSERVQGMLECHSGDVYEAVEEMYGMIWYLAELLSADNSRVEASTFVEDARKRYKVGLEMSPTKRFKKTA